MTVAPWSIAYFIEKAVKADDLNIGNMLRRFSQHLFSFGHRKQRLLYGIFKNSDDKFID